MTIIDSIEGLLDAIVTDNDFGSLPFLADALEEAGYQTPEVVRKMKLDVKNMVNHIYTQRQLRNKHPEGEFDKANRFTPSNREDCGDITSRIRNPSRSHPFSYMVACRTKKHVKVLVDAALRNENVPPDVQEAVVRGRERCCDGLRMIVQNFLNDRMTTHVLYDNSCGIARMAKSGMLQLPGFPDVE